MTALMSACTRADDCFELVEVLLEHGFDANAADEEGTPLLYASYFGHLGIMRALLSAKTPAQVDQQTSDGLTALFAATSNSQAAAVALLLSAGASPLITDVSGYVPLMGASEPATVRLLVEAAPDTVELQDDMGRTALMNMSSRVHAREAVEALFEAAAGQGVAVAVEHADHRGDTALHMAMFARNPGVVALLLERGAEARGVGSGGSTTLMKPFLDAPLIVLGPAAEGVGPPEEDAAGSACLRLVLDRLRDLLQGCAAKAAGTAVVGDVELPAAKRRRR
jgi:ankyrin repeat protein